jgi:CRISPR system Cascade subunit CasA
MLHDLLDSPLITWRDPQRRRGTTTLPGALSRLATGELGDFPRLRTHQLHPWCMFLTQLASIALHRAGQLNPRLDERTWRGLLLELTEGRHEPWSLVVEDLDQPAFFQPPVPERALDERWRVHLAPDDIDILVTAKAHDVKASLIPSDDAEAWAYALVTLQTTQGYPGRGYTGVARMKGGYGNRPRVGLAADQSLTSRFLRDVQVLHETWPGLVARGFRDDGAGLVWTQPWDGQSSLSMPALVPHFIEICWRVRCLSQGGGIACRYTTSVNRRCVPDVDNGDVGDPWAPIERDAGMLTVGSRGFHYELLRRLVFSNDFEPAAAQCSREGDPDPALLIASALVRGQGKTEGLHERVLELARPIQWRLGNPDTRAALGKRAGDRVLSAQTMRSKVLYPAIKQLGAAIGDDFDSRVDERFFEHLFSTLDDADEDARLSWESLLGDLARVELQRAIARCGLPTARRFKVTSAAEGMFGGCLKKNFPDLQGTPGAQGASS